MSPASDPRLTSDRPNTRLTLRAGALSNLPTLTFDNVKKKQVKIDRPNTIKQKMHECPFSCFNFYFEFVTKSLLW